MGLGLAICFGLASAGACARVKAGVSARVRARVGARVRARERATVLVLSSIASRRMADTSLVPLLTSVGQGLILHLMPRVGFRQAPRPRLGGQIAVMVRVCDQLDPQRKMAHSNQLVLLQVR